MELVTAAHEGRRPPSTAAGWSEVHRIDAWSADRTLGLTWSVAARPARARAGFLAAVLRADQAPVVLAEDDIALPERTWEVRSSGLWADAVCETPLEHWSYGLEAFALVVDDPAELVGRGVGNRIPLGWELEFEAAAVAEPVPPDAYRQPGEVHGLLLLGPDQHEVELEAVRWHWWGTDVPDAFAAAPAADAAASDAVALPEPGGLWWVGLTGAGLAARYERR